MTTKCLNYTDRKIEGWSAFPDKIIIFPQSGRMSATMDYYILPKEDFESARLNNRKEGFVFVKIDKKTKKDPRKSSGKDNDDEGVAKSSGPMMMQQQQVCMQAPAEGVEAFQIEQKPMGDDCEKQIVGQRPDFSGCQITQGAATCEGARPDGGFRKTYYFCSNVFAATKKNSILDGDLDDDDDDDEEEEEEEDEEEEEESDDEEYYKN